MKYGIQNKISMFYVTFLVYLKLHPAAYQEVLEEWEQGKIRRNSVHKLSDNEIRHEVVRFIIKDMLPLEKVQSPHLYRLINGKQYDILFLSK